MTLLSRFILSIVALLSLSTSYGSYFEDMDSEGVVLIGDSGKDNQGQLSVARAMLDFCTLEKCDYGMLAGDVVYQAGVSSSIDPILQTMFDKYYNQLNIPFLIALGNHDYGKLSNQWKRGSYQLLHAKNNPLFVLPDYYYIRETEHAVIAVLDTTRLMWRKDTSVQINLLKKAYALSVASGKWFIVLGHHPYLSNGKHGNAGHYERLRFPFFVSGTNVKSVLKDHVCGKADFYLSGHDHSLQVFDGNIAGCDTQLIVSGSAASATKLYERNVADFETIALGFFHISIKKSSVRLRSVDQSANILFEKTYLKSFKKN
jgi:tartrate-resistant acid phosphatase type 5